MLFAKPSAGQSAMFEPKFAAGMVCRVKGVHHPCFSRDIGKEVIICKLASNHQAWVCENLPISYKTNRAGQQVVARDPQCCQQLLSLKDLEPIPPAPRC